MSTGALALGLVFGSLAGLNSLGLVLLYRSTKIVNLAQPAMGLVGGTLTGMLIASAGWSFWWSVPVGLAAGALMGLAAERLVMVRLQNVPRTVLLVATIGLAQLFGVIQLALPFAFGGRLPSFGVDLGVQFQIEGVVLLGPHLMVIVLFPVATWLVWRFLHRTRLGTAACALGQDTERARALGVPANMVRSVVWALAGTLSAVSGILTIPIMGFGLGASVPPLVLLLALTPAVLAGFRSVWGTAIAAIGVGTAYQIALDVAPSAGLADVLLAVTIIVAVGLQRDRLGRDAAAARASSWEAATSPRPLPWTVRRDPVYRIGAGLLTVLALAMVILPTGVLDPSELVLYATAAAFAVAAVAVATAWIFAGEVALGHWGLAGLGAALALVLPGPLWLRAVIVMILMGASGAALARIARRRSGLAFAVLSLTAAVAAPVAVLNLGRAQLPGVPGTGTTGALAAGLAVLLAIGVTKLRSSRMGIAMVASRDDPQRAPWLGARPVRSRVIALGVSGAIAGLAGVLYLMAVPSGSVVPGAFDASRSLDLLGMGVVGGLGSPIGALLGAGGLRAAQHLLPGPWAGLASGMGIVLVVLFLPSGLSGIVERVRNRLVKLLTGVEVGRPAGHHDDDLIVLPDLEDDAEIEQDEDRVAGSDTREAWSVPSVRFAGLATALLAAITWAAALGAPAAWKTYLSLPDALHPWLVVVTLAGAVAAGIHAWKQQVSESEGRDDRLVLLVPATIIVLGLYVAVTADAVLATLALPLVAVAGGRVVGELAGMGASAVVPPVRSAASGIVVGFTVVGLLGAIHLSLVGFSSGLPRVAGWTAVYAGGAILALRRVLGSLGRDRRRALARELSQRAILADLASEDDPVTPALDLRRIYVSFGTDAVLHGVDLAVRPGEIVALVGGNGAGKSTLLKIAGGFVEPDEGRVAINGEDVSGLKPEERTATGLAFVSGARPVFPDMTVMENLRVGAYQTHRTRDAFEQATEAVLDLVPAVARRTGTLVGRLSGGEQRLLALAQTLYRRPAVLLADEVTLGLDVDARSAVLDVLRMLADDGVAVVVVDHDLPGLLPRSDRAVLLNAGRATEYDDPVGLLTQRADLLPATFLAGVNG